MYGATLWGILFCSKILSDRAQPPRKSTKTPQYRDLVRVVCCTGRERRIKNAATEYNILLNYKKQPFIFQGTTHEVFPNVSLQDVESPESLTRKLQTLPTF